MDQTGRREEDLVELDLDGMDSGDEKRVRIQGDRETLLGRLRQRAVERPVSFEFTGRGRSGSP